MGNDKSKPRRSKAAAQAAARREPSTAISSLQKMQGTIAQLEKRKEFIQKKIDKELTEAKKKSKANNKKGALMHLKRKKMFEKEATKLENATFTLEQQVIAIESGSTNVDVVNAMKQGMAAQKKMNQQIDVDSVAQLADDIQELQADHEEINEILGNQLGEGIDDDDLEAELAGLGEEEVVEAPKVVTELPSVPSETPAVSLPQVPTHEPTQKTTEQMNDEAALAELQAEMAK